MLHCSLEDVQDYIVQILSGLNVVHGAGLVHRGAVRFHHVLDYIECSHLGISARCIGLATREQRSHPKLVKLGNVGYYTCLIDLNKSNPIGTCLLRTKRSFLTPGILHQMVVLPGN